jgi:flagellar motility protein MotE (MotC chaperone)
MRRLWPWPQSWPRPTCRRATLLPALLAMIGVVGAIKIALLAPEVAGRLAAAAPEALVGADDEAAAPEVEPAAGPGAGAPAAGAAARAADRPDPQTAVAGAPAGPGRRFAADRLDPSEIEVLQQLAARRTALDRREQELDRHAALLATAEANLTAQLERLERLRAEIAATVAAHDAKEEAKLEGLVKIYETMKPKAAAEIFDRLELPILIRVVERMRAPKSADVLARMDPAKAKQVTTELARRSELLRAADSS